MDLTSMDLTSMDAFNFNGFNFNGFGLVDGIPALIRFSRRRYESRKGPGPNQPSSNNCDRIGTPIHLNQM